MLSTSYIGKLPPEDFLIEVSKGNVPGASCVLKFGMNEDIDSGSVPEEVWSYGGVYSFPTDVNIVRVNSTDAGDNATGTGARTITIEGLDSNYEEVSVDLTMNGVAGVNTTQTFTRVHRAFVKTAGSSEFNLGVITIIHQGAGTPIVAEIPGKMSQTQQAIYTIPAGKSGYLAAMSGAIVKKNSGVATLEFWQRDAVNPVRRLQSSMSVSISGTTTYNKIFPYKKIPEKTDVYIRCSYVSANDLAVFGNFSLILIDN